MVIRNGSHRKSVILFRENKPNISKIIRYVATENKIKIAFIRILWSRVI